MEYDYKKQCKDLANKLEAITKDLKNESIGLEYTEHLIVQAFIDIGWGNIRTGNKE
jgi:hypothetical protein